MEPLASMSEGLSLNIGHFRCGPMLTFLGQVSCSRMFGINSFCFKRNDFYITNLGLTITFFIRKHFVA